MPTADQIAKSLAASKRGRRRVAEVPARRETAPGWCPGHESCFDQKGPGPLCFGHSLLLAGVSGWGVIVAGREPAHVYRIARVNDAGMAVLTRERDGALFSSRLSLLRLVPLQGGK